jgi:hypothetical protein
MYVLNIIYLQPLNHKSTASGASLTSEASRGSLGSAGPSKGENGRLTIDIAENVRSLLHFRPATCTSLSSILSTMWHGCSMLNDPIVGALNNEVATGGPRHGPVAARRLFHHLPAFAEVRVALASWYSPPTGAASSEWLLGFRFSTNSTIVSVLNA